MYLLCGRNTTTRRSGGSKSHRCKTIASRANGRATSSDGAAAQGHHSIMNTHISNNSYANINADIQFTIDVDMHIFFKKPNCSPQGR